MFVKIICIKNINNYAPNKYLFLGFSENLWYNGVTKIEIYGPHKKYKTLCTGPQKII